MSFLNTLLSFTSNILVHAQKNKMDLQCDHFVRKEIIAYDQAESES